MDLYSYTGPVTMFDRCVANYWKGETYASSEKDTDISAVFDFNIARNDFGETAIQSFTVTPVYLNWYNEPPW